jgi:hypothetical protein
MKGFFSFLLVASAIAIVTGYARTAELSGARHVGEVEAVFAEVRDGLYAPVTASAPGLQRWAHVRFPQPLEDGRKLTTALLPDELQAKPGDLVEVLFSRDEMPTTESTRVTAVLPREAPRAALVEAGLPRH